MNTNSIPNTNSAEPQIAERLQNTSCVELSGGCLRVRWCFQGVVHLVWCIECSGILGSAISPVADRY